MNAAAGVRLVVVLVGAALAAIFGRMLGDLLASQWPGLSQLGVAAIVTAGVALILAAALIVLALPAVLRFVRCGFEHAGELLRQAWPALLLLGLGTLAVTVGMPGGGGGSSPTAGIQVVFGQRASHDSVFVPFFPVEGSSPSCSLTQTDFGPAQRVTGPGVEQAVKDLMRSLANCAEGGELVKVDIRGFASSSEFRGCRGLVSTQPGAPTVSEHLNWKLAEARRRTLIEAVGEASGKIVIEPNPKADRWSSPAQMRANMQFYDRNADGAYSIAKGALTRRAEIIILSKGSCEPVD